MRNCPIQTAEIRYNTEVPVDENAEHDRGLIQQLRDEAGDLLSRLSNVGTVDVNEALVDIGRFIRKLPAVRKHIRTVKGEICLEEVQKSIQWEAVLSEVSTSLGNEDMRRVLWAFVHDAKANCSPDAIPEDDDSF